MQEFLIGFLAFGAVIALASIADSFRMGARALDRIARELAELDVEELLRARRP